MNKVEEIKTCVHKVKQILRDDLAARDDDRRLFILYAQKYHNIESSVHSFMAALVGMPAFESITRARRKVQENPKYWGRKRKQREAARQEVARSINN